jgi:predicted dehydrogenase
MARARVGLVGVGPMAALHANVLRNVPDVDVVYCVSRSQDKADAFAAANDLRRGRTLETVMAKPEADALWVVAPADAMAEAAIELASLGLPMFLEKPVGLSLEETRAVRTAVTAPVMVGLNRRFYEVIGQGLAMAEAAGGVRAVEVHMPEDVARVPDKQSPRTKEQWQFANSVHMVDLFRLFGGEPETVDVFNDVVDREDRSYMGFIRFLSGAKGIYNAQWYAPGGWRLAVYATDLMLVYQPVEQLQVLRRGQPAEVIKPAGPDAEFKAGFYGQAQAFSELLRTGGLPAPGADLADYERSVALVDALTSARAPVSAAIA